MTAEAGDWQPLASTAELPPGALLDKEVGSRRLVVGNRDGQLFALDAVCPHKQGNLAEGRLVLGELACPLHGFRYDVGSGKASVPQAVPGVRAYQLKVQGDQVLVKLNR